MVGLQNRAPQIGAAAVDQQLAGRADRGAAGVHPGLPEQLHIAGMGRHLQAGGLQVAGQGHRTAIENHGGGAQFNLGHQLGHHPLQGRIQIEGQGHARPSIVCRGRQGQAVAVVHDHVV